MTADAHFKDFVRRQQRPAPVDDALDWDKERAEWLDYLQQLYEHIAEYLEEYIKAGTVKLRESTVKLNEEHIGIYDAKRLVISIGSQEIALNPVGTLLIGSKGRVDVEGTAGNSRLILIDRDIMRPQQMVRITTTISEDVQPPESSPQSETIEWAWKIVSRPPSMQFVELNKETLFEMLIEVSNG